jgi:protein-tyrosine-phosphatase
MKTILFVCVHNSGRSQMAEAFFNQFAKGKAKALSAGTDPADSVEPVVIEAMQQVGIDLSAKKPKALTREMLDQADKVVTMGCGVEGVCPATWVETEDWQLDDPKDKPLEEVRRIRDEIKVGVIKILAEVQ